MRIKGRKKRIIVLISVTAALLAAVIFAFAVNTVYPVIRPPSYSRGVDRTVSADDGLKIVQTGSIVTVWHDKKEIWALPGNVRSQDFFYEDVDHDGENELLILCWKRGRYGKHRPTWVRRDEIKWSQHIYIYEIADNQVRPKWMASDIGMNALSIEFADGMTVITDTEGTVTKWKWISWGLEKM